MKKIIQDYLCNDIVMDPGFEFHHEGKLSRSSQTPGPEATEHR